MEDRSNNDAPTYYVQVCFGKHCPLAGSREVLAAMEEEVTAQGLDERVTVVPSSCRNRCDFGPSVNVLPGPVLYHHIDTVAARRIVREHLAGGEPVRAYLFAPSPHRAVAGKRTFTYDPAAFRPHDDE